MSYLFKKFRKKKKTLLQILTGKHKRRPPSAYKRAFDTLVTVFSWFIRAREAIRTGRCFICLNAPIECCYHFFPSTNRAIRFEPDNACGACHACNGGEMMNRGNAEHDARVRAAHVRMVGEARVKELEAMRRQPWKKSAAEILELVQQFKKRLERREF